ncbi:MAG TPA: class I SAM-dependent methyltransferase [Bacillales bacterium]|nr:class I SAM-dependent methyltransferase [Bacillales bacterium]
MDYHDMLAHLGVGSAHPGGFGATINFLSHHPIPAGSRVLEVGCGTGRTSCYLAEQGARVTGLDLRPRMLEKAALRARKKRVNVDWVEGDITKLPFSPDSFDVIFAESVTVFADLDQALGEYYRVLVPGGKLLDREMTAVKPIPEEMKLAIERLYGAKKMPSTMEWLDAVKKAGFRKVEVWKPTAMSDDIYHYINMEDYTFPSDIPSTLKNSAEIKKISRENHRIMTKYEKYHGYGVYMGQK